MNFTNKITNVTHKIEFKTTKFNGLEYWICLLDGRVIAEAFSLPGLRSQVLDLIRHQNWNDNA